jgi:XTP/dITP diphosphohydrolase
MRLLIASNNAGKLREFETLLAGLPLELVTPAGLGLDLDVQETGATFEENARIKAEAYCLASGLATLADDSGLEVDALGGAPGVFSARYAGGTDVDRYRKLLAALAGVPAGRRTARFRCVIALAEPGGIIVTTGGAVEGMVGFGPRGEGGFGYDPVFLMPALGLTMAELPATLKDRVSHRAHAALRIRPALRRLMETGSLADEPRCPTGSR